MGNAHTDKAIKEGVIEMTRLKELAVGETFKRPGGDHIYQVTDQTVECGDNPKTICQNLTSGTSYPWCYYEKVIKVPHPSSIPQFYMCYVEGSGVPTLRHYNQTEAENEAERLARTTRKRVFLLTALRSVKESTPVPPLTWKLTTLK